MNNILTLRRRGFQAYQGWQLWLQVFAVVILFISLVVLFYFSKHGDLHTKPFAYMPLAYSAFLYVYSPFMANSKIEVDDFGISHTSEVPIILQRFFPDWRISWVEIEKVNISFNAFLNKTVIVPLDIKILNRTIKVIPLLWVDPEKEAKKTWHSRLNKKPLRFEDFELVKVFEARGLLDEKLVETIGEAKSIGSDLNSNPTSLGMVAFLFFALFYFITEVYFTLSEFYVGPPPYFYMAIGAIVAVIVSYYLLIKIKLALAEKIILALMMGASMAAVMYPLMLRVNEWTDTNGLLSYDYVKTDSVDWIAGSNSFQLPALTFDLAGSKYWDQFKIGDSKSFDLRKGGLGFYQLNMEPVYEEQRAFYEDK